MHHRKGSNLAKVLPAVPGAHVHLGALTGTMWALAFRIWTLGAIRIICWVVLGLGLCISVTHLAPLFPKELLSNWFLAPSNSFVGCLVFFLTPLLAHIYAGGIDSCDSEISFSDVAVLWIKKAFFGQFTLSDMLWAGRIPSEYKMS